MSPETDPVSGSDMQKHKGRNGRNKDVLLRHTPDTHRRNEAPPLTGAPQH